MEPLTFVGCIFALAIGLALIEGIAEALYDRAMYRKYLGR